MDKPTRGRRLPAPVGRIRLNTQKQENAMEHADAGVKTDRYSEIPVELIETEANIRHNLTNEQETEKIHELGASLKQIGQLEPVLVYKKDEDSYVVITGHRRLAAAKYAELPSLKCIVCDKPETEVDRLYIQAVENELREDLSPADRERYIADLLNAGQTQSQISGKLGKSASWISQTVKAKEGRDKFGAKFAEAKIDLDTYAAYQVADVPEEAVYKAIQAIQENPKKKKAVLKELERSKPQSASSRGRPRKAAQPAADYIFGYTIAVNEETKTVAIKAAQPANELLQELYNRCDTDITERIKGYFQEKGYAIA